MEFLLNFEVNWWLLAPGLPLMAWLMWYFYVYTSAGIAAGKAGQGLNAVRQGMKKHAEYRRAIAGHCAAWAVLCILIVFIDLIGLIGLAAGMAIVLLFENLFTRPLLIRIALETAK